LSEATLIENLRKDAQMRSETDKIISVFWVLLPLITLLLSVFISLIAIFYPITFLTLWPWLIGSLVLSFVFLIAYLYLVYMLINRRNIHFSRQWRFTEDLIALLKAIALKKGVNVETPVSSMERTLRDMKMYETEKSAILWVILLIVPFANLIASLYILYFLTRDFYIHERREDAVWEDMTRALSNLKIDFMMRRANPIPDRSYVLYIILSIITLGLFGIYWLYTLIQDPNNHFSNHVHFEDEIINKVSTAL